MLPASPGRGRAPPLREGGRVHGTCPGSMHRTIGYGLLRRRYGIMPEAIPYRPCPPASKLPKPVILESSAHPCPADASTSPETRCFAWLLASSASARTNQPRYRPQSLSPHRADRSSSPQGPRSCPLFVNPRWTPMTSVCCFPSSSRRNWQAARRRPWTRRGRRNLPSTKPLNGCRRGPLTVDRQNRHERLRDL